MRPIFRGNTGRFVQSAKAGVLGEQLTPAQLFETMAPPVPLTSSWLEWVSYSEFNQTMIIGFKGDVSFAYYTVPPSLFEGLVSASSPGKYFHKYIMHLYTGHRV